jgi:replicative DNA helicase
LYGGAAGGGKALDISTLIPTARGVVPLWSVGIGDKVFTDRGEHTDVIAESEIMAGNPCYELTFASGTRIIADAGHLWEVHNGKTWLILTTLQMAESRSP